MAEIYGRSEGIRTRYYLFDDLSKYTATNIENFTTAMVKVEDGLTYGDLLTGEPIFATRIIDVEPIFFEQEDIGALEDTHPNYELGLLVSFVVDGVEFWWNGSAWMPSDGSIDEATLFSENVLGDWETLALSDVLDSLVIASLLNESSEVGFRFHLKANYAPDSLGAIAGVKVTYGYERPQGDRVDKVALRARFHDVTGEALSPDSVRVSIEPDAEFTNTVLKTTSGEIVLNSERVFSNVDGGYLTTLVYPSDAYDGGPVTYTIRVTNYSNNRHIIRKTGVTIPSSPEEVDLASLL